MTHYLSICEGAWGFGAGITLLAQLPAFDPAYNRPFSIMVIVTTGLGILIARSFDGLVRYKKGVAGTDTAKLALCNDRVQVLQLALKLKEEEIAMKNKINQHIHSTAIKTTPDPNGQDRH